MQSILPKFPSYDNRTEDSEDVASTSRAFANNLLRERKENHIVQDEDFTGLCYEAVKHLKRCKLS